MKIIYRFNVNKLETVELPVEKEIDGKLTKVLEKQEKTVPVTYVIKKPNRADHDEAELFYSIRFSEDVRKGVLTRSEIIKRFANEDTTIKKVYEDYAAKEVEFQKISLQEKTPENLAKKTKSENELLGILIDIQTFELNKSSVFEHTAENRARNKTIFWWILNLAYKQEGDKFTPLFDGKDFIEKQSVYDKLSETEDNHLKEVLEKFFYFVPAWYTGQANTEEDFKKLESLLKAEAKKIEEDKNKTPEQLEEESKGFIPQIIIDPSKDKQENSKEKEEIPKAEEIKS